MEKVHPVILLADKLDGAQSGSLVLDGMIEAFRRGDEFVQCDGAGVVIRHGSGTWKGSIGHIPAREVRPRTVDIEAALALLPRGFRLTHLGQRKPGSPWVAQIAYEDDDATEWDGLTFVSREAPTAALAICRAAIEVHKQTTALKAEMQL
jgi:hypothetical protein